MYVPAGSVTDSIQSLVLVIVALVIAFVGLVSYTYKSLELVKTPDPCGLIQ